MKKITASIASLAIAFLVAVPVSACMGADGKPVEGTNGATDNCVRPEVETEDHFSVDVDELDFGRITELERSYTKTIEITNNTGGDVIIDVTAEQEANFALSDWIAFVGGATHFTVRNGASNTVAVRAYVPADANAGSQYAKIKVSDVSGYERELLAKIDIAADGFSYNSEVTGNWVNPVNLSDKNVASAKVKNTGNAGFAATYEVKKKNFFGGMDWDILTQEEQEVKPGSEIEFKNETEIGYGVYTVEQRVTSVNADGRIIESKISRIVINMPIWFLIAVGGVVLLIIVLVIVIKKHKKHSKKDDEDDEEEDEPVEKKSDKKAARKEVEDDGDDEIAEIAEKLEEDGEKITVHIRD